MVNRTPNVLVFARTYCRAGWSPIPVPFKSKRPSKEGWQHLRISEDELAKYFNGDPQNIGILLGEASGGLVDVDLDVPQTARLADQLLPETKAVFGRKSKPRSHWLYTSEPLPKFEQFKDTDGKALIEIRSDSCHQTIFPPSIHETGEPIGWNQGGAPAKIDGETLRAAVAKVAAGALLARHWPREGSRQDTALALAGGLLRNGWTAEEVADFIEAVTTAAGDEETRMRLNTIVPTAKKQNQGIATTGWPTLARRLGEDVVDRLEQFLGICVRWKIVKGDWEPPVPLAQFDLPVFPIDSAPQQFCSLCSFCSACAESYQVPIDLPVMLGLSVAASAIAQKARVRIKGDHFEPLNIFACAVLEPANRKSSVFREMTQPLADFEASEAERLKSSAAKSKSELSILEMRLKKQEKIAATSTKAAVRESAKQEVCNLALEIADFELVNLPRLLADDATPESVSQLLAQNSGKIALMSPEGVVFDIMVGLYSKPGTCNLDVYLKGHAGDDLRVNRIGRDPVYVKQPALTMGLAVQPEVLRGLMGRQGLLGRGLLARFLYSLPQSMIGRRKLDPDPISHAARTDYASLINAILKLESKDNQAGESRPHVFEFSEDALALLDEFALGVERDLGDEGEFANMRDWGGKLVGAVARIAGILHTIQHAKEEQPWQYKIDPETTRYAIQIGNYLSAHAKAAYHEMGADASVELARKLLHQIKTRRLSRFSKRDAHLFLRATIKSVDQLDKPITILIEHGYIREVPANRSGPGRKPSPIFEINPYEQNEHNEQNPAKRPQVEPHNRTCRAGGEQVDLQPIGA